MTAAWKKLHFILSVRSDFHAFVKVCCLWASFHKLKETLSQLKIFFVFKRIIWKQFPPSQFTKWFWSEKKECCLNFLIIHHLQFSEKSLTYKELFWYLNSSSFLSLIQSFSQYVFQPSSHYMQPLSLMIQNRKSENKCFLFFFFAFCYKYDTISFSTPWCIY